MFILWFQCHYLKKELILEETDMMDFSAEIIHEYDSDIQESAIKKQTN